MVIGSETYSTLVGQCNIRRTFPRLEIQGSVSSHQNRSKSDSIGYISVGNQVSAISALHNGIDSVHVVAFREIMGTGYAY